MQSLGSDWQVFSAGTQPACEVNPLAVVVMQEKGIDISHHKPHHISEYLAQMWDYVITVCGDAEANCPVFMGKVGRRLHIGFDDPTKAEGSSAERIILFRRVRDEIFKRFEKLCLEITAGNTGRL